LTPKVSIIIPNYNHKPYLKQRLDSVFNQTVQDFEVILLDDASTDGSQELLETYQNHPKVSHLIVNDQNSGSPFKQWQKGIELAQGEYIWIAESDDYCELHFLEKLLPKFDKETAICYAQTIDVAEKGQYLLNRIDYTQEFEPNLWTADFRVEGTPFIEMYLVKKNVIPNASAVLFKKELVDTSIFSQPLLNMKMCGDWFFWVKLCVKTNIAFVAEPLNYFRHHAAITRNHNAAPKMKRRLLEEAQIRDHLFKALRIVDLSCDKMLQKKWFKLHAIRAVFSFSFYKIAPTMSDKFSLLLNFLRFKLKL